MDSQITNAESNRDDRPARGIGRRLLQLLLALVVVCLLIVILVQVELRGTITVPIILVHAASPGLSAATIDVGYDPTQIQIAGCEVVAPSLRDGDCNRNTAVSSTNSQLRRRTIHSDIVNVTNGQIRFNLITSVPITQSETTLAELTVRPLTSQTTTVTLNIDVKVATEESGEPLSVEVEAGAIPRTSFPRGDVNCDGKADHTDVKTILAYDVGRAPSSANCPPPRATIFLPQCDLNGDTNCDSSDALRIPVR